ncbi:hypothetical protein ACTFIW_010870 [Dictyostelium discoideum]
MNSKTKKSNPVNETNQIQPNVQTDISIDIDFNKVFADLENIFKGTPNCSQSDFTQGVVNHYVAQNLNVFICHPVHKCDNYEAKHHYEFKTNLIQSKGYDIYLAHRGKPMVATNFGDGGESQWGYGGAFTREHQTIKYQ